MTLEEILNTDWNEQKDLSEYVNFFEDAQNLREQLQRFSFGILRSKLCTLDDIREIGIENFNFFNYACFIWKSEEYRLVFVPICRAIDEYRMRRRELLHGYYSSRDSIRFLVTEYVKLVKDKSLLEAAKWISNGYIKSMFLKRDISSDLFDYILPQSLYSLLSYWSYEDDISNYATLETIDNLAKEIKYFHSIPISREEAENRFSDRRSFAFCTRGFLLNTSEIIRLGLLDEVNELNNKLLYLYNNSLDYTESSHLSYYDSYKLPYDGLFFINEIRQPLLVCSKSSFREEIINNKEIFDYVPDLINITVDKDNYKVYFEPEMHNFRMGIIYQQLDCFITSRCDRRKGLVLDLVTDELSVIENYE